MLFLGETTTPVFATGVLCGAVLLIVGLVIGTSLGRRNAAAEANTLDDYQLGKFLRGLMQWTDGFASDVSKYRQVMDIVNQQVSAVEKRQVNPPEPMSALLSQIVKANDLLQQRLDAAEKTLQAQATDIAAYLSEARTDMLTSLPNRRVFEDELGRRLAEFRRHNTPLAVLMIDIDHFKKFNDRYGHLAGDQVLIQVAKVLRDTMRESDLVARLGGEEFAAVLPATTAVEAGQAAERVRLAVEQAEYQYESTPLHVTISCGAAPVLAGEDATSVVKRADQALYASKSAGRNCAHWNDGRENILITVRDPANPNPIAASMDGPGSLASGDFMAICDELRQRVQSVIQSQT